VSEGGGVCVARGVGEGDGDGEGEGAVAAGGADLVVCAWTDTFHVATIPSRMRPDFFM
jgi:hypothetical protein